MGDTGEQKHSTTTLIMAWITLGTVLCILYLIYMTQSSPQPIDMKKEADYACRQYIRSALNDPASAEFEPEAFVSTKKDNGEWWVTREVRAKNGFNALRLATFDCKLRYNNGEWLGLSVEQQKN